MKPYPKTWPGEGVPFRTDSSRKKAMTFKSHIQPLVARGISTVQQIGLFVPSRTVSLQEFQNMVDILDDPLGIDPVQESRRLLAACLRIRKVLHRSTLSRNSVISIANIVKKIETICIGEVQMTLKIQAPIVRKSKWHPFHKKVSE